ncbi:MAG TPA: hypothetical protein VGD52_17095 [Pseudoduganella sp.]
MTTAEFLAPHNIPTLTGTPDEVGRQLKVLHNGQVIALVLEHSSKFEALALERALGQLVQLLDKSIADQNEKTLNSLVETLVPRIPPPPALVKEAAMIAKAQKAVLEGADWVTAKQVAEMAGMSDRNPSAQPNKWKRDGAIFAITLNGNDYYPGYGLDRDRGFKPLESLKKIISEFGGTKSGWGLAYWFQSVNSFLGGKRPMDLLVSAPEKVIAAAADEMEGVVHG